MPEADHDRLDLDAEPAAERARGLGPGRAADPEQQGEAVVGAQVEGRDVGGVALQPDVRQRRAGVRGGLVVQVGIAREGGEGRAVADHRPRLVALPHLDPVRVELPVHQVQRGEQRLSLLRARGTEQAIDAGHQLALGLADPEAERLEQRTHLADALVGAIDDLAADRLALRVVAVEQGVAGLARGHQRELPGDVVRVLDRGVAAEPVRGRMAVRRVAGEEQAPVAVALRDHVVDLPGADLLDLDRHVRVADREAHALQHRLLREVVELQIAAREDRAPLVPRLDAGPDAEQLLVARADDEEQRARAVLGVLAELRLDPHRDRVAEPRLAVEREAALLADHGARAVAADHVARTDLVLAAVAAAADAHPRVVHRLVDRHHLAVEADLGAEAARRIEQDRLEHVLRSVAHRARARRGVVGVAVVAGAPGHHAGELAARERGREHLLAHQVLRQRAAHDALLDAEVAEDLHRALVGDVRARRVGGGAVLGHRERLDPGARQQGGGGQARRACADHQNVRVRRLHGLSSS